MSYPNTIGYPSDGEPIEATADRIASSRAAEVKMPLKGGLERDHLEPSYSARQFLEREPKSPATEPATGGRSSGPHRYVHSARISAADDGIREAHRRPEWHALGAPEPVALAWEDVLEKIAAAKDAMGSIPAVMAKAERDRAALLTDADAPTVLPSPGDARAWAEEQALAAIRAAKKARADYDRLLEDHLDEHAANLAATVPTQAEAIGARVAGLKSDLVTLREGVRAVAEVAGAESGRRSKSLPRAVPLGLLDDIERELADLQAVADEPSEVALVPSLRERAAIAAQARQVVGGISSSMVRLARIEAGEAYAFTSHTKGIPQHVLHNAEQAARFGA